MIVEREDIMKVKDLISQLKKFDPELDLICYQDTDLGFEIYEINSVSENEGEKTRLPDQTPSIKFGKSSVSTKFALLDITSDF